MKSPDLFLKTTLLPISFLLWTCSSGIDSKEQREVEYSVTSLKYEREGVNIAAQLWLPEGSGPHPAVVMAHGSGRARKEFDKEMA